MLCQREVRVFATGRNTKVLSQMHAEWGCAVGIYDLNLPESPRNLYQAAVKALGGPPDFVVNNAGYNSRKASWVDVSDEELDGQYRVNLRAPAIISREAVRDMSARGSGHLVNVASSVVLHGCETMGAYSAMKSGLYGLTKVLIKEARPYGVKVTVVHPGGTDTGFREKDRPDYMRPESAAHMICDVLFAPSDVVVHELTFRPLVETNF